MFSASGEVTDVLGRRDAVPGETCNCCIPVNDVLCNLCDDLCAVSICISPCCDPADAHTENPDMLASQSSIPFCMVFLFEDVL